MVEGTQIAGRLPFPIAPPRSGGEDWAGRLAAQLAMANWASGDGSIRPREAELAMANSAFFSFSPVGHPGPVGHGQLALDTSRLLVPVGQRDGVAPGELAMANSP